MVSTSDILALHHKNQGDKGDPAANEARLARQNLSEAFFEYAAFRPLNDASRKTNIAQEVAAQPPGANEPVTDPNILNDIGRKRDGSPLHPVYLGMMDRQSYRGQDGRKHVHMAAAWLPEDAAHAYFLANEDLKKIDKRVVLESEATGELNSAGRTATQQKLATGVVAPPGSSSHEKDGALDVSNYTDPDVVAALLKYGFQHGDHGTVIPNDKDHFSFRPDAAPRIRQLWAHANIHPAERGAGVQTLPSPLAPSETLLVPPLHPRSPSAVPRERPKVTPPAPYADPPEHLPWPLVNPKTRPAELPPLPPQAHHDTPPPPERAEHQHHHTHRVNHPHHKSGHPHRHHHQRHHHGGYYHSHHPSQRRWENSDWWHGEQRRDGYNRHHGYQDWGGYTHARWDY